MPDITVSDVADIVNTTLPIFHRKKLTDIATSEESHLILPRLLQKESVKYDGGETIKFDAIYRDGGGVRNIGLYDKDQVVVRDVTVKGQMPWRRTKTTYAWDVLEFAMNRHDPVRIQNLVGTRRAAKWLALSNHMEDHGSAKPASDDGITPMGLRYWIVKSITGTSAATGAGGFNGTNPSGFSSGAGNISSTTYPAWANWAQAYVNVTDDDLVDKMRVMAHRTKFKSPIAKYMKEDVRKGGRRAIYLPFDEERQLVKIAEGKNENLGRDLAPYDGGVVFHGIPLEVWPYLDDDSDNPIYYVDWAILYFVLMSGMGLKEGKAHPIAGMSETVGVDIKIVWNTICTNRRKLGVLSTAADND